MQLKKKARNCRDIVRERERKFINNKSSYQFVYTQLVRN